MTSSATTPAAHEEGDGSGLAMDGSRFVAGLAAEPELLRRRIRSVLAEHGVAVERLDGDAEPAPDVAIVVFPEEVVEARRELPRTPLVAVAPAGDGEAARRLVSAGADGIVPDEDIEVALVPTVDAVRTGQLVVPRYIRGLLGRPVLTTREKQVLAMVVMGLSNAEIASRLFVAETTVKSHLRSGFRKLGVRSRQEAATLIADSRNGLGPGILQISKG